MKGREIEKIAKDIRRAIGKIYKYKQSDYINWKIQDGYFFCLKASLYYNTKIHNMYPELYVKPVYIDDIYWKIIYPHREKKLPDSLRGNGLMGHVNEEIWKDRTPETLNTAFLPEVFEQSMKDIFLKAEQKISAFLQKYPNPDLFGEFLAATGGGCTLMKILVLINEGKFAEAGQLAKEHHLFGHGVSNWYVMGEGENRREKSEYEFIMEYCQSKITDAASSPLSKDN